MFADPLELQVMRLAKKIAAGARFLITQPIFDFGRFETWWKEVAQRGIHEKVAILCGVEILTSAEQAKEYARKRPFPMVPDALIERIAGKDEGNNQRAAGIEIALETIERLGAVDGLRGFEIFSSVDDTAVLEVIDKSGLKVD